MSSYSISELALKDIDEIWIYTLEKWSLEQADRYYLLIIQEINYLSHNPNSGKSIDYIRLGYRSSKVKSHIIFYKINESKKIEIIRVLHEKMDFENSLMDTE